MKNICGFALLLSGFWLANSGYFKPLFLGWGLLSVAGVMFMAWRMKVKDGEFFPAVMPSRRLPGYLLWMAGQIVKANIDVVKHIRRGPSSLSPVIVTVKAGQKSEIDRVLYANAITMTPGTVTLAVRGDLLEVHALTREAAAELKGGEMNRRVVALEEA